MNRRSMLMSAAGSALYATAATSAAEAATTKPARSSPSSKPLADYVTTTDGTRLYCKAWGDGAPVVFVHSWAMAGDMWQYQIVDLADRDLRCITYDRRGHGRSDQPSNGYDIDTLADDLARVIDAHDLSGVTLIGHSMGGAEIVRYLTRHGHARVARIVLLAPTTPYLLQSADNPDGVPAQAFEAVRTQWRQDFPKWVADNTRPFFTADTSEAMMRWGTDMLLRTALPVAIACNQTLSTADFRAEMSTIDTPALVIHGDADASAPLALTGARSAKLLPNCELKVYAGAPHGLFITHAKRVNADIIEFIEGTHA
jgi:non-heme chloroperoxidase